MKRDPDKARAWAERSAERARQRQATAPRKRVRPVSEKRAAAAPIRRELVADLLARYPRCQACGRRRSTEVHERLSRARGGSITDERHGHMVALCHSCHSWITTHPAESVAGRWLLPSWHKCPPIGPC